MRGGWLDRVRKAAEKVLEEATEDELERMLGGKNL